MDDHNRILKDSAFSQPLPPDAARVEIVTAYIQAVADNLETVGIQLQAKNRDFWDSYDREMAEGQFRYGIAPPLTLIIVILAVESGSWWWLLLLAAPIVLAYRGFQHYRRAASTLVQAIVLKMVEPPVVERLQEMVDKKREEEKKAAMSVAEPR